MDTQFELEKLKSMNVVLEARLSEEKIQSLQAKIKFHESNEIRMQELIRCQIDLKDEQLAKQKIEFELERATWSRQRGPADEPKAKVARVEPRTKLRKVGQNSLFRKLLTIAVGNSEANVHAFLDYNDLLESEDNSFQFMTTAGCAATLAEGNMPSESGRYRAIGVRYVGPRVSTFRLRKQKNIKEAYGVARNDEQFLVLILFFHDTIESVSSFVSSIIPIKLTSISVYTEGAPTSETALAMVKKPSEFKWMYNA